MARRSVKLVHFAATLAECPASDKPEICLSGRSNVGKSSLINLLTHQKKLAYTSRQPGKTRVLTYYEVDEAWHMVDMPGYGFAKVPQGERNRWQRVSAEYLRQREQLVAVIQLVDLGVGPTREDVGRLGALVAAEKPLCVVMTKADKVSRNAQERKIRENLNGLDLPPDTGVVLTSAKDQYGHKELWAWIDDHLPS